MAEPSERMTDAELDDLEDCFGTTDAEYGDLRRYRLELVAEVRRLRDLYEPEERDETPVHVLCGTVPYPNPVPGGFDYDCKTCGMCFDMDRTVPRWRYDAAQRILRGE